MAYLHDEKENFYDAIAMTYNQTAVVPPIIEKDYYVTMLLMLLSQRLPHIVFKGGTSLSKCYRVINRFSEDIDIAMDEPVSQGIRRKIKKVILEVVDELGMKCENVKETRSRREYNRYVIAYDSVLASSIVRPSVLLEMSYVSASFPAKKLEVHSHIGDMMISANVALAKAFDMLPFAMKVQGLDRTLADKVFAICDYYMEGKQTKHSRHIYDIYKLLPLVPRDGSFKKLVAEVRKIRSTSKICPSAQDGIDISALLHKIVEDKSYKKDYDNVTVQLLGEVVSYDTAIEAIKKIAESDMF